MNDGGLSFVSDGLTNASVSVSEWPRSLRPRVYIPAYKAQTYRMMSSACVLLADARHLAVPGARASDLITGLAMVYLRVRSHTAAGTARKRTKVV